uniref:Uncharacterized protein n=1 Tax=viral metagenome TaxID=1070528 RepID=A0A6M3L1V7_9ZZZZ
MADEQGDYKNDFCIRGAVSFKIDWKRAADTQEEMVYRTHIQTILDYHVAKQTLVWEYEITEIVRDLIQGKNKERGGRRTIGDGHDA